MNKIIAVTIMILVSGTGYRPLDQISPLPTPTQSLSPIPTPTATPALIFLSPIETAPLLETDPGQTVQYFPLLMKGSTGETYGGEDTSRFSNQPCYEPGRGQIYRDLSGATIAFLAEPMSWSESLGASLFDVDDARVRGAEAGAGLGSVLATFTSLSGYFDFIMPIDVTVVIFIMLITRIINLVVGLIARIKVIIKWW